MASETVKVIMAQVNWRELQIAGFVFVEIDSETLRLHKGKKNLDIHYDAGYDLYNISKHTIDKDLAVTTEDMTGVYADQLQAIIEEFFGFEYVNLHVREGA